MARIIVNLPRRAEPPLRLALGTDAYEAIGTAYRNRLDRLEAAKEINCPRTGR